jgi:hypothetical protein
MTQGQSLLVSFNLREEDLFQYLRDHGYHLWRVSLIVAVLFWITALDVFGSMESLVAVPLILVGGGMSVAAGVWWHRFHLRRVARRWYRQLCQKAPGTMGDWRLEITPEGLSCSAELGDSRVKWALYQQVRGTATLIYFDRPFRAPTIIPRRAFTSPEEAEVFLQAAKDWHAAATAMTEELNAA